MLQVMSEVQCFLRLLGEVYTVFGLEYSMALSTRPESYLVSSGGWDAEIACVFCVCIGGRAGCVYAVLCA
jgi:threonyl-tRNA synthetase